MLTKTKTIAMTAHKRPQYFEQAISTLIKNDLQDWDIYIQIDPSDQLPYFFEIAERLLKPYHYFIAINQEVLGVKNNPYHMLDKVFMSGSLCCIYLEEDVMVSPDITKMVDWYLKQDHENIIGLNLIMGGCMSAGLISNPAYPSTLLKTKMINSLGLVFTAIQWERHIKPNWLRTPEHAINWLGVEFEGWDLSLYDYLINQPKLSVIQPLFARITHIGAEGGVNISKVFQERAFSGLGIYENENIDLNYQFCENDYTLPHSIRSQLNLWQELKDCLVALKRMKRSEIELKKQLQAANNIISEQENKIEAGQLLAKEQKNKIEAADLSEMELKSQLTSLLSRKVWRLTSLLRRLRKKWNPV